MPAIVSGLADLFKVAGHIRVENMASSSVEVALSDGTPLTVAIHGKLDLAVFGDRTVDVFDFKTKKGMTQAEIKGETKNSDGNYFRQLVFYNLLLAQHTDAQGKAMNSSLVFLTPDETGRIRTESLP